jgi:ribosomal protein L37E
MELLVIWLALCAIPAWVASQKGRSAFGFFLLALCLSPIVGISVALIIGPLNSGPAPVLGERGYQAPPGHLCGSCGKHLSPVWKDKCAHCGAAYAAFAPVPK